VSQKALSRAKKTLYLDNNLYSIYLAIHGYISLQLKTIRLEHGDTQ